MKSIKGVHILVIGSIVTFLITISCSKQVDTEVVPRFGYVLFHTNAQYVLDCGQFDVKVFIDNTYNGVINKPNLTIKKPPCESGDTIGVLKIELRPGLHNYSADYCCGNIPLETNGQFVVIQDSCVLIYLDIYEAYEKN